MANELERMAQELLPCPFCGGEPRLTKTQHGSPVMRWVQCLRCEASSTAFPRHEHAISAWNTRAIVTALQQREAAQEPVTQAVVIPEPSDEDVEAAWVAFQANIPGNTMRALLSNDRARLRERIVGQALGGDGDA